MTFFLDLSWKQLLLHDNSKFSRSEFVPYSLHLYGCGKCSCKPSETAFENAWKHHYTNNAHHCEYWQKPCGDALPMPAVFCREMIADWLAANVAYSGKLGAGLDVQWLSHHLPDMNLHRLTKQRVWQGLIAIGEDHAQLKPLLID